MTWDGEGEGDGDGEGEGDSEGDGDGDGGDDDDEDDDDDDDDDDDEVEVDRNNGALHWRCLVMHLLATQTGREHIWHFVASGSLHWHLALPME